ncbi:MAG: aminopeptidase [Clostridia bacterium]|nr:aminopeptidase [Clostridia bacterium]
MSEMTAAEAEELLYKKQTVYAKRESGRIAEAYAYAEGYKKYLDASKTEREAVTSSIELAESYGFTEFRFGDEILPGGKYYYNNRGKNLFLMKIGTEGAENGIRISAAHIDSPRLDLKQVPLFESEGFCFLKTHYYGGIRKYQWVAIPLALHGVVAMADGSVREIRIGEDPSDPVLYVNDLLPHLGHKDDLKPLGEAIPGEKLNLLVGSVPLGDGSDAIKLNVLKILNEKFGISEEDFISAELSAVPVGNARDAGLDRSMICGYGHDDRVCAYPALTALFESLDSPHTLICVLADKEETGSDGNTGMQCDLLLDVIDEIARALGSSPAAVRAASKCLSADVSAAYDPNFSEAFEKRNSALVSCGVVLNKYTGARGKSGTNDASAEFIGWLRGIMAADSVVWQTGELGKIDYGGGGTVAKFISKHNIDTVDLGVPVLSMHAPYEIISKVDLYEAHRAFAAFNRG